jgi:hypothetical protein
MSKQVVLFEICGQGEHFDTRDFFLENKSEKIKFSMHIKCWDVFTSNKTYLTIMRKWFNRFQDQKCFVSNSYNLSTNSSVIKRFKNLSLQFYILAFRAE